ncbi:MAG TPA: hypothetical protein VGZ22_21855 [Isosphaeraceae bacterium]|jgi:hypothetical protein|nr:hypothetical protein [Isosphaeraceae bacterium]
MREEDYSDLKDTIESSGFFTSFHRDGVDGLSLVLASTRSGERLHGNSFKVSRKAGRWYLVTWSPVLYLIPPVADLPALCLDCLRSSSSPIAVVPHEIVSRYGLREISEEDDEGEGSAT